MAEVYRPDGAHDSEKGRIPGYERDFLDFSGMCVDGGRELAVGVSYRGATAAHRENLNRVFLGEATILVPACGQRGKAAVTAFAHRRQPPGFPPRSGDLFNARMETLTGRW
jgi:hypothetical protein